MYFIRSVFRLIFTSLLVVSIADEANGKSQDIKINLYSPVSIKKGAYTVQLRNENDIFFCAGALVAPQFVVTAAACVDDIDRTAIHVVGGAGTWTEGGIQRSVTKVVMHPSYDSEHKFSNVAVLKLNEPLEMGSTKIKTIGLPTEHIKQNKSQLVVGWRQLYDKDTKGDTLYFTFILPASQEESEREFGITPHHNAFCALGNGYDDQYSVSDLGGPANAGTKLVGIATSCHNCNSIDYAVCFTDIFKVRQFIETVVFSES